MFLNFLPLSHSVFFPRFIWWVPMVLMLLSTGLAGQSSGGNVLHGNVIMPEGPTRKVIRRGDAYRNQGNEVQTASREGVEAANHPDMNVVVILYPEQGTPALKPTPNAILLQTEKTFVPKVLPVTKGSTIIIENADDFYHNVFSITPGARFNIGRRPPGNQKRQLIDKSGEIKLFCDIHPQMNAVILSLETPYFTRVYANGRYRLDGIPDGRYRYEIYHPEAGVLTGNLQLKGGNTVEQHFDLRKL